VGGTVGSGVVGDEVGIAVGEGVGDTEGSGVWGDDEVITGTVPDVSPPAVVPSFWILILTSTPSLIIFVGFGSTASQRKNNIVPSKMMTNRRCHLPATAVIGGKQGLEGPLVSVGFVFGSLMTQKKLVLGFFLLYES
jgi:hypothetical protein